MSTLTRVFVVLLVLFAMITSAAEIVYVQQTNASKDQIDALQSKFNAEETLYKNEGLSNQAHQLDLKTQLTAAQGQIETANTSLADAHKEFDNQALAFATVQGENATQKAQLAALADAMKVAQDNNGQMQKIVADLRGKLDTLQSQHNDDAIAISDKTNLYDEAANELKLSKEQLAQMQTKVQTYLRIMSDHGLNPDDAARQAEVSPLKPVPPITGHVTDTSNIGGVPYVTLSVGSADAVSMPMMFYVFDQQNATFLGQVSVEKVDPNDCIGRLSGPPDKVSLVKVGNEARTHLTNN